MKILESDDLDLTICEILTSGHCSPSIPGQLTVDTVAHSIPRSAEEIGDALKKMVDLELLRLVDGRPGEGLSFAVLPKSWEVREQILRRQGRRLPQLLSQLNYDLEDLVLAIAMTPIIHNQRLPPGFWASAESISILEISIYLCEFSVSRVLETCITLKEKGLLDCPKPGDRHYADKPVVKINLRGRKYYKETLMEKFGLAEKQGITDLRKLDKIEIFYAWQSDYKQSRNQILDKLEDVVKDANQHWQPVAPLSVTQATEIGDGAVKIDNALIMKIKRAQIFVGDVTPVFQFAGRLCPNPNVLIESGFALASMQPEQVLLLQQNRPLDDIPGDRQPNPDFPFDIANTHRIMYNKPADLKERLKLEIQTILRNRMLLAMRSDRQ